jgi:hypothetical protein
MVIDLQGPCISNEFVEFDLDGFYKDAHEVTPNTPDP